MTIQARTTMKVMGLVALFLLLAAPTRRRDDFGDAIGNYNFRVEIDGVDAGEFTAVDGLSIEQEVVEYQNGDDPLTRKRPGRVKYGDITLKRGYTSSTVLNDWIEAARLGNGDFSRRNLSIILSDNRTDTDTPEIQRWNLFECFPRSWKLSPLRNPSKKDLREELAVVCEWFEEVF